jgi:hypothetical protein
MGGPHTVASIFAFRIGKFPRMASENTSGAGITCP